MAKRVETKVIAAGAGGGGGTVIGTAILWAVGAWWFGGGWSADQAPAAIAAVPQPLSALILATAALIGSFVSGWLAPHTSLAAVHGDDEYVPEHRERGPVQ